MTFAIIKNNAVDQYPLYQGEIENHLGYELPYDWQGGEINGVNYVKVHDAGMPQVKDFEEITIGTPIYCDNRWNVNYVVTPWTAERIAEYEAKVQQMLKAKIALQELGLYSPDIDRYLAGARPLGQPEASGLQEL